jgi:hypothetical protein
VTLSLWLLTRKLLIYLTIVVRDPQLVAVDPEVALAEALTLRTAREQYHHQKENATYHFHVHH